MTQLYKKRPLSLTLVLIMLFRISTYGQTHQTEFWQTDGLVKDAVAHQNNIYLGGDFGYFGSNNGPIAHIDTISGASLPFNWPRFEGPIYDIESDGRGGWFVAGAFIKIGTSTTIKFLARVNANGTIDQNFRPNPNIPPYALHRSGNTLYVGGGFSAIFNGQTRSYLCAINLTNNTLSNWNPAPNQPVFALGSHRGQVIVGGKFNRISGFNILGIAAVDSVNSSSVINFSMIKPSSRWPDPEVYDIEQDGDVVYAVGAFQISQKRNAFAFNMTTRRQTAWVVNTDTLINSITKVGTNIYLGGRFTRINGLARNHVAVVDTARTPNVGALNLPISTTKTSDKYYDITSVEVIGDKLYVGGRFNYYGSVRRHGALRYNLTTNTLDTNWTLHSNGSPNAIRRFGTGLIAFGNFSSSNGMLVQNLAKMDRTTLVGIPTNLTADSIVNTLQVYQNSLFIGGMFKKINGTARQHMAKVMLPTETLTAFAPVPNLPVNDFELFKHSLYVGGRFNNFMGQSRTMLAKVNLVDSSLSSLNLTLNGDVNAVKYTNGRILIGGAFTSVNSRSNTSRFYVGDTATGATPTGYTNRSFGGGAVRTIGINGQTAYVGGDFTTYNSANAVRIHGINLNNGLSATSAFPTDANNPIYSLNVYGSLLYIAGNAVSFGTTGRNHVASYDLSRGAFTSWFPNILDYCYSGIIVDRTYIVSGFVGRADDNFRTAVMAYQLAAQQFNLSSFSPSTAPAGTTITLSGVGFNRVDRVTFGGQNAVSFTIVDDNTIRAVVGTGNPGHVAIFSGAEKDSLAGFWFCPTTVPTWTADTVRDCAGVNIRITANTGYDNYLYSNGTSSTSNGTFVTTSGSYTVRGVIGACTTAASAPIVVIVTPIPTRPVIRYLTDSAVCGNNRAIFEVRDSLPGMRYLWNTGLTTRRISGPPNSLWSVRTIVNSCTSVISAPTTVDIKATPANVQNVVRAQCYGTALTGVAPGAGNGVRYFASDTSNQTISLPIVTANAAYYYEVYNLTTGCPSNRAGLFLNVHPRPDSNFVRIAPNTLKAVDSTTAGNIYQWIRNGRPISGANQKSYVADSNGTYQLLITNSFGCSRLSARQSIVLVSQAASQFALPLMVYPNPANTEFVVTGIERPAQSWQLINQLGQVISSGTTSTPDLRIDVSNLSAGPYRLLIGGQAVGVVVQR